jgi:hypothetical protein
MSWSERMFHFHSAAVARDEDSQRWREIAQNRRDMEQRDFEDSQRRIAEYDARQQTYALEKRHATALAFLKRLPFDQVATTRDEIGAVVRRQPIVRDERTRRAYEPHVIRRWDEAMYVRTIEVILKGRTVFDDGITYPDIETIARHLAHLDGVKESYTYLSLPHVMIAERIHIGLTNFERYGPPERP